MLTMYPVSKGRAVVVEGHVVRHVEPEPHGGGVHHGEVGLLGEVGLIDEVLLQLHQVPWPHNDVLLHHGDQGQPGGPHVLLQQWVRHY